MLISRAIVNDQDGLEYETSFINYLYSIIDPGNGESVSMMVLSKLLLNVTDQWKQYCLS